MYLIVIYKLLCFEAILNQFVYYLVFTAFLFNSYRLLYLKYWNIYLDVKFDRNTCLN